MPSHPRPWYWAQRGCYACQIAGRRHVLQRGPKNRRNYDLAVQRLATLLAEPVFDQPIQTNPTVADLIGHFLADCEAREAVGEIKQSTVTLFYRPVCQLLKKECGSWRANQVCRAHIAEYRRRLQHRNLSPTTLANRLAVLRHVLRWAKRNHLISRAVHESIPTLPRRRREKIPTEDEIQRLMDHAPPDVQDVLACLVDLPVRPGDIFALKKGWVDLDADVIRFPDTKTGPRICVIAGERVKSILRRRIKPLHSNDDFVFATKTGNPWRFRYFGELVRQSRERAGLGKHVISYGVRHFWTTNAILNGVPIETVRQLRGDRDIKTVVGYLHLADHLSHLQAAARQAIGLRDNGDG